MNTDIDEQTRMVVQNMDNYFSPEEIEHYRALNIQSQQTAEDLQQAKPKQKKKIKWKPGDLLGLGSYGRVILGFNLNNG